MQKAAVHYGKLVMSIQSVIRKSQHDALKKDAYCCCLSMWVLNKYECLLSCWGKSGVRRML